jgi:hypothetical protein
LPKEALIRRNRSFELPHGEKSWEKCFYMGSATAKTARAIKEKDKNNLSTKYCNEVEHGIVSPDMLLRFLGYPPEARQGTLVMNAYQVPLGTRQRGVS